MLGPWLATAYLVVPRAMVAQAEAAWRIFDDFSGGIELGVLARFIESSTYTRHLRRVRRIYGGRREATMRALRRHFGEGQQSGEAPAGGMAAGFALAWVPDERWGRLAPIAALARECGLPMVPVPALPVLGAAIAERLLLVGCGHLAEDYGKDIVLFYPGQTSYKWSRTESEMSGAKAFRTEGKNCDTCNVGEANDMGPHIIAYKNGFSRPAKSRRSSPPPSPASPAAFRRR